MGILDCMCRLTGLRVVRPVQACRRALRCSLSGAVQRVQEKGSLIREGPLPAHTLDATGGMLGMALCNLPARYPWEREGTGGPHAGCTDDEGKGIKGKVGEGGRAGGRAMKGGGTRG